MPFADIFSADAEGVDRSPVAGLSPTVTRRIVQLRMAEARYLRDGLEAARIFCEAGRPSAVDRFIGQCLTASRRARRLARTLEERAVTRAA